MFIVNLYHVVSFGQIFWRHFQATSEEYGDIYVNNFAVAEG